MAISTCICSFSQLYDLNTIAIDEFESSNYVSTQYDKEFMFKFMENNGAHNRI